MTGRLVSSLIAYSLANRLQALGNVQRQREELCRAEDVALWTAFDYVRRNRNSFKSKVYDPVRLSVSVKDKRHARVAEAAINYAAMKTIVCLEKDDYTSLGDTFTKFKTSDHPDAQTKDLRVNVAELPADMRDPAQYERPCTQQQVSYPEPVCYPCIILIRTCSFSWKAWVSMRL